MAITYTTGRELKSWGTELEPQTRKRILDESKNRAPISATFLSHSSKDEDLIPGVIRILQNHGADVYLDKIDPSLPPYTSTETANTLRDRKNVSKKFVLLASENSKDSRWVPWELGLAHGFKNLKNIAIFPSVINKNENSWTRQEYLGIYDRIVWGDHSNHSKPIWMVLNEEKNTATELAQWLARE